MQYNPELMRLAEWRINQVKKAAETKEAFQPAAAMDQAAAGGAPPGGPPMDPSMMGGGGMPPGMPPMDPSMMAAAGGGAPPPDAGMAPAPGSDGLTADSIRQIVQQTIQQSMNGGAANGGAAGKPAKPDINTIAMDIYQVKKMLSNLYNTMGIPLPPDIIDGPNRDPSTGLPMPPGAPGSTSDMTQQATPAAPAQSAIPPIQPMEAAMPQAAGQTKTSQYDKNSNNTNGLRIGSPYTNESESNAPIQATMSKASALAKIFSRLSKK